MSTRACECVGRKYTAAAAAAIDSHLHLFYVHGRCSHVSHFFIHFSYRFDAMGRAVFFCVFLPRVCGAMTGPFLARVIPNSSCIFVFCFLCFAIRDPRRVMPSWRSNKIVYLGTSSPRPSCRYFTVYQVCICCFFTLARHRRQRWHSYSVTSI